MSQELLVTLSVIIAINNLQPKTEIMITAITTVPEGIEEPGGTTGV